MRKLQKTQIMGLLDTLCKASRELVGLPSGSDRVNLCADIQDFVSGIFDFLQRTADKDTRTSGMLANFYEKLFTVSQEQESADVLIDLAAEIADCADHELKADRIEVAFFCYKASMSDCLESIYLAAKADPDCDAYFIPIPYFDRNKDGSLGEIHCEAEGYYSEQYELTDWQRYKVEERRPDVIFIMNPYDECNLVTTVHPDYYARKLKDFTGMLVYVPYLVHSEVISPEMAATPGVLFAHRTIVQSENIRKQYVDSACAYFPEISREMWEKRIIALGSPKTDRVLLAKKEMFPILKEWEKLLAESQGRRVILYNLSLETAILFSQGEKKNAYLEKLRSVLWFFKERKDVLLWWRPHPLLAQTFLRLDTALYREYQEIVREYQEAGYGIFDGTADMDRAIAFSDACYGDESSLNLLMQLAGKPVLVQNIRNAGNEPTIPGNREHAEKSMKEFAERGHYNSYILYEVVDPSRGGFSLSDFLEYLDVVECWREEQSGKYRARYTNADGSAGQKIYDYVKKISEEDSK